MKSRAEARFRAEYGAAPAWSAQAPGRVNLIGEHVDYAGGLVLPAAVDRYVAVAGAPAAEWELRSDSEAGLRYVQAVGVLLAAPPQRCAVEADLPVGGGLSSSAALLVATAAGLEPGLDGKDAALACQKAEQQATGVRVGIMDQFASALGRVGHAVLINCLSLAYSYVPFPDDLAIAVIDSGQRHDLANSPYNARRDGAVAALGDRVLIDLKPADAGDEPLLRHMITETARVLEFVDCLRAGQRKRLGQLLNESHASLRDDFQVSTARLDEVAQAARAAPGCLGARLMGAGFGGSVLALVESAQATAFSAALSAPVLICHTADGAFAQTGVT